MVARDLLIAERHCTMLLQRYASSRFIECGVPHFFFFFFFFRRRVMGLSETYFLRVGPCRIHPCDPSVKGKVFNGVQVCWAGDGELKQFMCFVASA